MMNKAFRNLSSLCFLTLVVSACPQTSSDYIFGGGLFGANHTRIIDLILAEDAQQDQAELLSNYPSSQDGVDSLGPDDFAQVPMLFTGED